MTHQFAGLFGYWLNPCSIEPNGIHPIFRFSCNPMNDTIPMRKGEELDIASLAGYLRRHLSGNASVIEVSQFPAGASNLTYCIKFGEEYYVLRRPPFGNRVKTAHDMSREFTVLSKLANVYPPAPKPIIYCGDESVIGSEFYLMERRSGVIIRGKAPHRNDSPPLISTKKICKSFIDNLAILHSLDYKKAGLGGLGKPEGYIKRQVEGWTKRYFDAKTDQHAELEIALEWLSSLIPEDETASLVHNDYKFDNVMLNPNDLTETVAVLDWEMATIGSPLMDLGTTLAYWMSQDAGEEMLSMPFNPRVLMENVSRRELAEMYAASSGRDVSNILYFYVFGTIKVAVIAQQIYYRFVAGHTRDKRFSRFGHFVSALGKIAIRGIESKDI